MYGPNGMYKKTIGGLCCMAMLCGGLWQAQAAGGEWFDLNGRALASFDFAGTALPSTIEELKQRYPEARLDEERAARGAGLECYRVDNLPAVDLARFYFCDGRLYQFEARYELPRIEKLGGMRFVVKKLVDTWGPVDHAGESRWTWQRPMYSRRADFYAWPDSGQLTITDTGRLPIVDRRIREAQRQTPMDLGFETR